MRTPFALSIRKSRIWHPRSSTRHEASLNSPRESLAACVVAETPGCPDVSEIAVDRAKAAARGARLMVTVAEGLLAAQRLTTDRPCRRHPPERRARPAAPGAFPHRR